MMKKLIVKFIDKRIVSPEKYNYFFYRWLISILSNKQVNKNLLSGLIGYFEKSTGNFPFTDIFVLGKKVYIYTIKPGVWIGKRGYRINDLKRYLNSYLEFDKIEIIEDKQSLSSKIDFYQRNLSQD